MEKTDTETGLPGGGEMPAPGEMRLSTRALPASEQFNAWREAMATAAVPTSLTIERRGEGFIAETLLRHLGPMQLACTTTTTDRPNLVRVFVGPAEISRTAEHSLMLGYRVQETNHFRSRGNAEQASTPGSWSLFNTTDRLSATAHFHHARHILLRIPQTWANGLLEFAGDALGVPHKPHSMANALVGSYLEALAYSPAPTPGEGEAIGRHLLGLLTLAVRQTRDELETRREDVHAALVLGIERDIEANYLLPDYAPPQAAIRLGISPRYLHRVLEPTGQSFSRRVMQKRLAHARRILSTSGSTRSGILEVALESGFVNAEHFSQCFRAAFGMSPRDFRDGRGNR